MLILRILKYFLITVVLLFIVFQIKFMPSYQIHLTYKGHNITITRDQDYNIPSIKGESKLATFYGFGYATAEDRLFQLHMKRMIGKGRLSEMVGEKGVNLDIFFRELGVGHMSRLSVERMKVEDPESYHAYQAYADGVNTYAKEKGLGIQFYILWTGFEDWQVEDTFVIFKLTDWVQSADGGLTVARELLAQEVGRQEAVKILGYKEEHFILVNESTMMSDEELRVSGQSKISEVKPKQVIPLVQIQIENQEEEKPQHVIKQQQEVKIDEEQQIQVIQETVKEDIRQNEQQPLKIEQINQTQIKTQEVFEQKREQIQTQTHTQELIQNKYQQQQIPKTTPQEHSTKDIQPQSKLDLQQKQLQKQVEQKSQEEYKDEVVESIRTQIAETHKPQQQKEPSEKDIDHQSSQVDQGQIKYPQPVVQEINIKKTQSEAKIPSQQPLHIPLVGQQIEVPPPQPQTQNQPPPQQKNPTQIKTQDIDSQFLQTSGNGGGSNSWVISGKHTKSSRPILANDPHLATAIPSDWFQAEVQYPHQGRNITFKGAFIAGTSFSAPVGRGDYISWGCTTQYKDTQDFYKEKVQGSKYFVDGQWRDLKQRQERIRVKNGEDRLITISETHRGPLMSKMVFLEKLLDVPGNVSFAWTGFHNQYDFLSFMLGVMEADHYVEVREKFASLDYGPAMNVVYMTRDDEIGYQSIGRVPRRKGAQSPFFFDGTTTENDWDGYITGRDKLYLDSPEKGFIVTANSRPANSNFKPGYYDTNFQVTSRQHRLTKLINQKIASGEKLTVQDSIDMQLDNIDEYCAYVLPYLKRTDARFGVLFGDWGCDFTATYYQGSIYEAFLLKLQHKLYPYKTLNIYGFIGFNHYTYKFIISTSESQQPSAVKKISDALTEGLALLETKFGTNKKQSWLWGQLHLTSYPHLPFSNSPLKSIFERHHISSGSLNTPNVAKLTKLHEDSFTSMHHATLRMVLTFAAGESRWLIDTGVSSYPFSNHYDDQQLLHKDGKYIHFETVSGERNQVSFQL